MTTAPEDLLAGYSHRARGVASYRGALREKPKDPPVWTCAHDHMLAPVARACAQAEKDRRVQGAKQVLLLLRCVPCNVYLGEKGWEASDGAGHCPYCDVPLGWAKVLVLERSES